MNDCDPALVPAWRLPQIDLGQQDLLSSLVAFRRPASASVADNKPPFACQFGNGRVLAKCIARDIYGERNLPGPWFALPPEVSPVVIGNVVIFRNDTGIVACGLADGSIRWKSPNYPITRDVEKIPFYHEEGDSWTIDNGVYALTAADGMVFALGEFLPMISSGQRRPDNGPRRAPDADDTSSPAAFSVAEEGRLLWRIGIGQGDDDLVRKGKFLCAPAYEGRHLYVVVLHQAEFHLLCLEAATGKTVWKAPIADRPPAMYVARPPPFLDTGSIPSVADGRVHVLTNSGVVGAFDSETGRPAVVTGKRHLGNPGSSSESPSPAGEPALPANAASPGCTSTFARMGRRRIVGVRKDRPCSGGRRGDWGRHPLPWRGVRRASRPWRQRSQTRVRNFTSGEGASRMHRPMTWSLPALGVLVAGLLMSSLGASAAAQTTQTQPTQPAGVSFPTQAQLGNVFVAGEKIQIEAAVESGQSVDWTVSEFLGGKVDSGTAAVAGGKTLIAPRAVGKGYYLVQVTARPGGQTGQTSYAVIAPVDYAKVADPHFGVDGQYSKTMPVESMPLLAKAGVSHVRDDLPWDWVEKEKGSFDFARLAAYTGELSRLGIAFCPVMAFGNKLYDAQPKIYNYQLAPYTPEGYEGYANYCLATLKHYGPQVRSLEIWNEYNGSFCAGKAAADRPKHYTEMLRTAYQKVKAQYPDVEVVGGAMVKIPLPWFEKLCKAGAMEYMDAIAVHPYQGTPDGVERSMAAMVEMTRKYNGGKSKPIWVTECGTWRDQSVERAESAGYLVRMYTLLLTCPEVARIDWFLVCDYAEFRNQGLFHGDKDPMGRFTPVVGYPAYANLIQQLHHASFLQREQTDPRTRAYQFQRNGRPVWVCWSTSGEGRLTFATGRPVRLVDMVGAEKELAPTGGQVAVTAGEWPVYVTADKGTVTAVAETPRKDRVIADSVTDFSAEQGKGNWSYLYYASNKDGSAAYEPGKAQAMKWVPSPGDWEDVWSGPAPWYSISEGGASPGVVVDGQGWAIRRWTSDRDGAIHVVGKASRGDKNGDGVVVKVFPDGREIFSKPLPPKSGTDIDLSPTVAKGSQLDFVVTPGPGTDSSYDFTGFRITILTPPQ